MEETKPYFVTAPGRTGLDAKPPVIANGVHVAYELDQVNHLTAAGASAIKDCNVLEIEPAPAPEPEPEPDNSPAEGGDGAASPDGGEAGGGADTDSDEDEPDADPDHSPIHPIDPDTHTHVPAEGED